LPPKRTKSATTSEAKASTDEKSESKGEGKEKGEGGAKGERILASLSEKVIVNVQNTQMSRFLMARIVLEGNGPGFEELVKKNDFELRDVASGVLQTKSIQDLDSPSARNLLRAELLTVFRNILGQEAVKQVWLPELAVQ